MVEVLYRNRLGNNLFQYCLGRLLAEEFGYSLKAEPLEGFPNTADTIHGEIHSKPEQILEGQLIDLHGILSDRSPRKIVLDGWFQRYEYYRNHRQQIQRWLAIDPVHESPCRGVDLVINVRRTDYIGLGWALPFAYYKAAIDQTLPEGGNLCIVTDDPNDPFFRHFRRWHPAFFEGTPLQQMSYMSHAPRLVMSASTFSWWPAFLGKAETVVCPVPSWGIWNPADTGDDINLIERDRFTCIEVNSAYEPDLPEKLYQRARSYKHHATKWINKRFGLSIRVQNY